MISVPIFIEHADRGLQAQLAGQVGYNKMAQQGFENNLQRQQLEDRRRIYEAQIARDEEAKQQQDFKNSLDLAKYNQLGNYRDASLGQRSDQFGQRMDLNRDRMAQRLTELQRKIDAGVATREDVQEHQTTLAHYRLGQQNDQFNTRLYQQQNQFDDTFGQRQERMKATDTRASNRLEWDRIKTQALMGNKVDEQSYQHHWNQVKAELGSLEAVGKNLSNLARSYQYFPDKLAEVSPLLEKNRQDQLDARNHLSEVERLYPLHRTSFQPSSPAQPSQPTSITPTEDFSSELPPPEMMNAGQGGLYIGQIVTNPSGAKGKVIGFQNGKAMVEANVP